MFRSATRQATKYSGDAASAVQYNGAVLSNFEKIGYDSFCSHILFLRRLDSEGGAGEFLANQVIHIESLLYALNDALAVGGGLQEIDEHAHMALMLNHIEFDYLNDDSDWAWIFLVV